MQPVRLYSVIHTLTLMCIYLCMMTNLTFHFHIEEEDDDDDDDFTDAVATFNATSKTQHCVSALYNIANMLCVYVTGFWKNDPNHTLEVSR